MAGKIKGTVYVNPSSGSLSPEVPEEVASKKEDVIGEGDKLIYEISSVFPLQIFPDKILIDKNKITIIIKELFFKRLFPILYDDIQTVKITRGIIFASLEFEVRGFETNPPPITHLWPKEAKKAEDYIMAMMKAVRLGVEVSKYKPSKIKKVLWSDKHSVKEMENVF